MDDRHCLAVEPTMMIQLRGNCDLSRIGSLVLQVIYVVECKITPSNEQYTKYRVRALNFFNYRPKMISSTGRLLCRCMFHFLAGDFREMSVLLLNSTQAAVYS